jgi:hypothetical protein
MLHLLLHLLFVPLLLHWLTKKLRPQPLGIIFLPGLILKIAAGWAVNTVFLYYYGGGDVAHTFQQSMLLRDILTASPMRFWQFPNDVPQGDFYYLHGFPDLTPSFIFICKITALISLLTGKNIWLISSWFSAFAFAGFWLLGNELCRRNDKLKIPVVIAFFLVPSVAFWSAGLLKETLLWGAMGILFWAVLWLISPFHDAAKPVGLGTLSLLITIAALAAWILLQVKYYIFAAVMLAIAVYVLLQWQKRLWIALGIAIILLPLLLWAIGQLHPNLSLNALATAVHRNYARMVAISDADNLIWLDLQPDFISLISQLPFALKAAVLSPLPWEGGNLLRKLTGIENLVLLLLALGIRLPRTYPIALIAAAVLLISTLAVMLALSAPNIGALARYKVSYLPLLWLLVCSGNRFLRTLPFQKLKALF